MGSFYQGNPKQAKLLSICVKMLLQNGYNDSWPYNRMTDCKELDKLRLIVTTFRYFLITLRDRFENLKGLLTVSECVCDCDIANK